MRLSKLSLLIYSSLFTAALHPAIGATVDWANWTSQPTSTSANGVIVVGITSVMVSYSGEIEFTHLNGTGANYFLPTTTFTSSDVTDAPPTSDIIGIDGTDSTHTFTFSAPVVNPVFEIVSLGQPGHPTTYTFDLTSGQSLSILSQGPSNAFGGCSSCLSVSGNTLSGTEGDGLIQLNGTFSSVSFTGSNPEFWNGITVGAEDVASTAPEPGTWTTMLLGVGGLAIGRLRRRRS